MLRELRYAARRLSRSPGFACACVITLGLGIATATAVYSLVHSTVINPLPYPESDRLVWLDHAAPGIGADDGLGMTDGIFVHYRERITALEHMAIWRFVEVTLTDGDPERIRAVEATPSLFTALRVPPALGRVFVDESGSGEAGGAMISHGLWVRRFGADPGIVGRAISADGLPIEVRGVMPPDFEFPHADVDLWLPLLADAGMTRLGGFSREGIARLASGESRQTAEAEIRAAIPGLGERFGVDRMLEETKLQPLLPTLKEHVVHDVQRTLWILLGSVAFVLLLACANVANLLLVRAESGHREAAVRRALGAGRIEIARYFLAEGLLLSVGGTALGLLGATLAVRAVVRVGPEHLPRLSEIAISPPVLLVALAILICTTLVFGAAPALTGDGSLSSTITSSGRGASAGRSSARGRNALVATQVGLALVLLVATGLMSRSFLHLVRLDPGFQAKSALTFHVGLPSSAYPDQRAAVAFHREALERIGSLPGVEAVGATTCLPLCGRWQGTQLRVDGRPVDRDEVPRVVAIRRVSEQYFAAVRTSLVAGRLPSRLDHESESGAAVVSRELAVAYWPNADPIGERFVPGSSDSDWYTVVGVVEDTPIAGLADDPPPMAYLPLLHGADEEASPFELAYVVRTSTRPHALLGAAREAIRSMDPQVPLSNVATLDQIVSESNVSMSFTTVVLGVASGIALMLGLVGIYGVISYMVGRRGKEIAIRLALGARSDQISRLVLAQGGRVVLAGLLLGLVGALTLTRVMRSLLYGVSPTDPVTFGTMAALLLFVALAATYIPARRAARVDPAETLRAD